MGSTNEFNPENYGVTMVDNQGNSIDDIRKYCDSVILFVNDNTKLPEIPYRDISVISSVFDEQMPDPILLDNGVYDLLYDETERRIIWCSITEIAELLNKFWKV